MVLKADSLWFRRSPTGIIGFSEKDSLLDTDRALILLLGMLARAFLTVSLSLYHPISNLRPTTLRGQAQRKEFSVESYLI